MRQQSESIKSFNLPFFSGIEAITGKHIVNEFRRHIHKTYIVGIVTQGIRVISHSDGSTLISEGEIFIVNPGQVHSCRSESLSEHSYKILSVAPRIMQSIASQISEKQEAVPYFKRLHYDDDDELSGRFFQLFDRIKEPESDIKVESTVYDFLSYLLIHFSEFPPLIYKIGEQNGCIKRVCNYIDQHFSESLSLKKLSEIACLSPFHFQREFKKYIGITPHEYLSDFRVGESKRMLLNSDDIADVAIQSGFFDQSHFSRIFRKTVGISPGKYKKINRIR